MPGAGSGRSRRGGIAFPPLLSAVRWRLGASVSLLVVAVLAVFTAAAGPLFLATADVEVLHTQLNSAGSAQTAFQVSNRSATVNSLAKLVPVPGRVRSHGLDALFGQPVYTEDHGLTIGPFTNKVAADFVYRSGVCAHLHFIQGSCPSQMDQIAMTQRDATKLGLKLGQKLESRYQVSGIVAVGNSNAPYWMGDNFFQFAPAYLSPSGNTLPALDAFFATKATLDQLPSVGSVQFPLRVSRTLPDGVPQLRSQENRLSYLLRTRYGYTVTSGLNSVLNAYDKQASDVAAIVGVVALQLILLVLFVLYVLVARTAVSRRSEVALAKLRGASLLSLLVMGIAEPALILLISLPVGLILAYIAMEFVSRLGLHAAPVPFSLLALLAALAAFCSGIIATAAGSRKLLSRPLVDELRASEDKPNPAVRAAGEGVALALAAAGLVELATAGALSGSHPNPVALFAPGLIAMGLAVPCARLLPAACAYLVRRTRNSRRIATGLAVRQVIRRPAALRQVLILTVAVGLSAFAVIGWSVAARNRTIRADFDLGAARVVQVQVPPAVNLVNAVRQADPSGHYAMAVMESRQANSLLLAVDASRLGTVAYWPKDLSRTSLRRIVRWLSPKLLPPLVLSGQEISLTADLSQTVSPPPDLVVNMLDSGGNAQEADFGYLSQGSHQYSASLPPACALGCRVISVEPVWTPPQVETAQGSAVFDYQLPIYVPPPSATYTVALSQMEQMSGGRSKPLNPRVYDTSYWGSNSSGAKIQGTGSSLVMSIHDNADDDVSPGGVPAPLPTRLHAVSTVASQAADPVTNTIDDFDGYPLHVNTSPQVVALPNLGSQGDLMNLQTAQEAERGTPLFTESYVWEAPHAPPRILARLKHEGVSVLNVTTPGPAVTRYNQGGLGLGYQFFVFAAGAAAALAVATTILSFFLSARRRSFELAVLRAMGVSRQTLSRALLAEQCLVLIPGLIFGIAAAIIAGLVALPAVPEFGSNSGQPPLQLGLPALAIAVLGLVFLVILVASAFLAGRVALGQVDMAELRMELH
ncbi:MAG: FtsX-like permease family protein [Candidatus Dormibacteria bacterium]